MTDATSAGVGPTETDLIEEATELLRERVKAATELAMLAATAAFTGALNGVV